MRILVSGGGTGGHISPVLAVVSELKKHDKNVEILYIGSDEGLESKIIPQTGLDFRAIPSGKFRRYHSNMLLNIFDPTTLFKNAKDLYRFGKGFFEAKELVREFDPDVVFTKGGYVSLPVGLAAHSLHYPLLIHESDSVMGLANKILAKRADKVCVSYPTKYYPELSDEVLVYSGNPVREDIFGGDKKRAKEIFSINGKLPVLLVIGGSQGALAVNKIIADSYKYLLEKYEVIHVSGERDYDWLSYQSKKLPEEQLKNYHLFNYLSGDLKEAYEIAELVISRAGNNVISELGVLKKPTIFIPLTSSANNHQVENARIISRAGAGIMVNQETLTPQKLVRQIDLLFEDKEEMEKMGEQLYDFAKADASIIVAEEIIKLGKEMIKEREDENQEETE